MHRWTQRLWGQFKCHFGSQIPPESFKQVKMKPKLATKWVWLVYSLISLQSFTKGEMSAVLLTSPLRKHSRWCRYLETRSRLKVRGACHDVHTKRHEYHKTHFLLPIVALLARYCTGTHWLLHWGFDVLHHAVNIGWFVSVKNQETLSLTREIFMRYFRSLLQI